MMRRIIRSGLDWIRREVYERPSSYFRVCAFQEREWQRQQFLKDGYLILPGYFNGSALETMRADFERSIHSIPISDKGEQVWNALTPSFWKAAHDPTLKEFLEHYWGWTVGCTGFAAKRLHSCDPFEYDSYQWHHDNEGKRLRMLVYLTDVGPEDQRMDYRPGSQTTNWDRISSLESSLRIFNSPVACTGPAGTVILFDANGYHSGHRNHGAVRDSLNFRFTSTHWTRFAAKFPRPWLQFPHVEA